SSHSATRCILCFPGQILSYSPVTLISMAESSPTNQHTPAMGIRQWNGSHWRVFVQCRNAALAAGLARPGVLYGPRVSVTVGISVAVLATLAGLAIGLVSGASAAAS